jgi:hypothetical protein
MASAAGQILPELARLRSENRGGDHLLTNSSSTPLITFFDEIDKLTAFSILWLYLCNLMQEGKTLLFSLAGYKEYEKGITPGIAEI